MLKSGLVSITFRELSPGEVVELVAKAGLDGIEWGGDVHVPHGDTAKAEDVRKLTEDAGLSVAAYGSYYRAGVSESEGLSFSSVLESTKALGAPVIRVWPGNKGSADASNDERAEVVSDLKRIDAMAAAEGIGVSCEYHCNTLTDTNDSAQKLLGELEGSGVKLLWQPPNGESFEYCMEGLEAVLPSVTNIHTFHWIKDGKGGIERRPLGEGEERWCEYLKKAAADGVDRYALIEFVFDGTPEQFLKDAQALKGWLGRI